MPPQLVIADAPYKRYPGGIIALRATDWLAGARGTLSTESNALAIEGEVVRDTQQVTQNIDDDPEMAYQEALDTLSIPMSEIPIEEGLYYNVYASYRLEGEWDVTDLGPAGLLDQQRQDRFVNLAVIGGHGTDFEEEDGFPMMRTTLLSRLPYFASIFVGQLSEVSNTHTIGLRTFSFAGTTIEWLVDQIVFIPMPDFVEWSGFDFKVINGGQGFSDVTTPQDGADGGDANGKFTWLVAPNDTMQTQGFSAGGDFQRKSSGDSAEWLFRLTTTDNMVIWNTLPAPDEEPKVHAYSLQGVRNRGEITYTHDNFDNRTISPPALNWGVSPEGYGYHIGSSASANPPTAFVSGGIGVLRARQALTNIGASLGENSSGNLGARTLVYDQWDYYVRFRWATGTSNSMRHIIYINDLAYGLFEIRMDWVAKTWTLGRIIPPQTFVALGSAHDISSWFAVGAWIGLRWEMKRALMRCRLWDDSGAEPSTWDESLFKVIRVLSIDYTYPYGDDAERALNIYDGVQYFGHQLECGNVGPTPGSPLDVEYSDIILKHDPYGSPADMTVRMERPEGTTIGEIVIPYGATYFVYWGSGDYTDMFSGTPRLVFSTKIWNDPSAAEIQRADAQFWYFRSVHGLTGLVPMHWQHGRQGNKIVLRG